MTEPVLILTMKWGTLYGAEDVNRLHAQVRRHLARPHRFVCFTDDPAGLDPGVEAMPLPELGLPEGSTDTRWRKLALFNPDLGLEGTALFLDLDLVIVGPLDPFFEVPGEVVILRDDDLFRAKPLRRLNPARDRFLHMDPGGYAACCRVIRDMDLRQDIRLITTPTLIIAGAEDLATPVALMEDIRVHIAGSELVILPDAAHILAIEQADRVNRHLLGFLGAAVSA